jgi:hypothetical protein
MAAEEARARTPDGPRVKGIVVRTGVAIPPPAGPLRDEVLRSEGSASLRACTRRYGSAVLAVMPMLPPDLQELPGPRARLGAAGRSKKLQWEQTRAALRASARRLGFKSPPGEDDARAALRHAVDAFNYLEDTELADSAHAWVHTAGALVGGMYGCRLPREGSVWWDTCPVLLAHKRIGWSPGFTARRMCSICEQDISQCEHLPRQVYPVVAHRAHGVCSICLRSDCDEHEVGAIYAVHPSAVISDAHLREISLVPRPRDPLARFTAIEIERWMIRSVLGPIPPGATSLTCLRCTDACGGFSTPTDLDPIPAP